MKYDVISWENIDEAIEVLAKQIEESKIKKEYLEYLKNFEIQVYEESIQASPFKDYQSAWAHYQDWV